MRLHFCISLLLLLLKTSFVSPYGNQSFTLSMTGGRGPVSIPGCGFSPPPCNLKDKYRRPDGSCTNPYFPVWGEAGDFYINLISPPNYQNGIESIRYHDGPIRYPSARELRTKFFPDEDDLNPIRTLAFMTFAQMLIHDSSMIVERVAEVCCTPDGKFRPHMTRGCAPIPVYNDKVLTPAGITCMNFTRAVTDLYLNCNKKKTYGSIINTCTSAFDLSPVYGNSDLEQSLVRKGKTGYLKTRTNNWTELLPIVNSTVPNCRVAYVTGDFRGNQNMALTALHTCLAKEHNRIAGKLHKINTHWRGEKIFQEARRVLVAIYQHIVYYEWLPIYLNKTRLYEREILYDTDNFVNDFDRSASPAISAEYAHGAARAFHAAIPNTFQLYSEGRKLIREINLSKNLGCQDILEEPNMLEAINVGLVTQRMGSFNRHYAESISEYFDVPVGRKFGQDLIALDIQRARDAGIQPYISYKNLFGLGNNKYFDEFVDLIDKDSVKRLKKLYKLPQMVELSVAGLLEFNVEDSYLGPTFHSITEEQFLRSRKSDYRFYESPTGGFTVEQLNDIRNKASLALLLCNSAAGVERVQSEAFNVRSVKNPLLSCSKFPDLDWSLYAEKKMNT